MILNYIKNFWQWLRNNNSGKNNNNTITSSQFNIDVGELIAETYATEEFGKGLYFETEDTELLKKFQEFRTINKLDQTIWRLIKIKNLLGHALIKFDLIDKKNKIVEVENIADFTATKAFENLIQVELSHQPLKALGKINSNYQIKEFWTKNTLTRYFFYNRKRLSFSTWNEKIPKEYQFDFSAGFEKLENRHLEYRRKNPYNEIPMILCENIDAKADLPNSEGWNMWLNGTISEIAYDTQVSRPFFQIGTLDKQLKEYVEKTGLPEGIFLTTKFVQPSTETKFQAISAPNRIAVLSNQIELILKLAFNFANSSYATQLERVPARAEELANSKGGKTVFIKRKILENDLKLFMIKIFNLWGFKNPKFTLKLLPNTGSVAQNIEENIRKTAFGLATKTAATADVENVDFATAKEIQKTVKKETPAPDENKAKTEISAEGKIPENPTNSREVKKE